MIKMKKLSLNIGDLIVFTDNSWSSGWANDRPVVVVRYDEFSFMGTNIGYDNELYFKYDDIEYINGINVSKIPPKAMSHLPDWF